MQRKSCLIHSVYSGIHFLGSAEEEGEYEEEVVEEGE